MTGPANSENGTNASHMIVGPDNRVTSCTSQDVSDRVALGRWAAPKFNKLLGTRGFDLYRHDIELRAQSGLSVEYTRAAYEGLGLLLKGPNPPRFGVGMLGSVWVDLTLAGKQVRVALDPSEAKERGRWGLLLMPLE